MQISTLRLGVILFREKKKDHGKIWGLNTIWWTTNLLFLYVIFMVHAREWTAEVTDVSEWNIYYFWNITS